MDASHMESSLQNKQEPKLTPLKIHVITIYRTTLQQIDYAFLMFDIAIVLEGYLSVTRSAG
jgi:hypothetical protein